MNAAVQSGDDLAGPSVAAELREIAKLAFPITAAQLALMLLGLVDVAILGHTSATELGGASVGRSIGFVAASFGIGAASALEPLAAQAHGAREPLVAWRSFVATLATCMLLWGPGSVIAVASTWLLGPLGIEDELVAPARAFLVAQVPGLLLFPVFIAAKTLLQAQGKTLPMLVSAVVANVVNVGVCGLLVRGDDALAAVGLPAVGAPKLGALGAGLANSISNAVLAGGVLLAAWRGRPHAGADDVPARDVSVRAVLRVGLPIGLQLVTEIGVFSLVSVLAGRLGKSAVSAHQIALGLASFTFMGALGVSAATSVRVGYAVGEGRSPRRAGLVGIVLGAAYMALCGLVFLAVPRTLVALFSDEPEIVALGTTLLLIAAAFQLFDGVQGVASGALRGAGDVRVPFYVNVAAHWCVGFPLALLLGFHLEWGTPGLWWGLLAGLAVVAVSLSWRFFRVSRGPIARI